MTSPTGVGGGDPRGAVVIAAACLAVSAVLAISQGLPSTFGDLRVWQEAASTWLSGESPYDGRTFVADLTFNYPPSSLVLLAPLAWVPSVVVGTALVLVGMAVIWVICRLALPNLSRPRLLMLVAVLSLSEPALATFSQGQLGYLLLGAMVAATIPATSRTSGVLLGLATALKLYPVVGVALERRARAGRTLAVTAAVVLGLGTLAVARVPSMFGDWWAQLRAGLVVLRPEDRVRNQSWRGLLDSVLGESSIATVCWVIIAISIVIVGVSAIRLALRAGERIGALSIANLMVVLAAPVAWTHYWVFLPLLLGTVTWRGTTRLHRIHRNLVLGLMTLAQLFVVWIPVLVGAESPIIGGSWILTYAYVLLGTAVLVSLHRTYLAIERSGPDAPAPAQAQQ